MEFGSLHIPLPLNSEILKWANRTHELLSTAKLPSSVRFYNIYGTNCDTPHSVWYSFFSPSFSLPSYLPLSSSRLTIFLCSYGGQWEPVSDLKHLLIMEENSRYHDHSGKVPQENPSFHLIISRGPYN
jgi:hypothetical protein